jgi:predicted RNase H-like HicB family nuclease
MDAVKAAKDWGAKGDILVFLEQQEVPISSPRRERSNPFMSGKSKRSSGKAALDRPFAPGVLDKARKLAGQHQVIVWHEEVECYGRWLESPHVYGDGRTPAQCIENTREALVGMVATLLERGPRRPANHANRRTADSGGKGPLGSDCPA